jgi:hypothetical protein
MRSIRELLTSWRKRTSNAPPKLPTIERLTRAYPGCPHTIDERGVLCFNQYETDRWEIQCRRVLARYAPHLEYSCCASCNLPWWVVTHHIESWDDAGNGCFAICEQCFQALGREEAWPYYAALICKHHPELEEQFKAIFFSGSYVQPLPPERGQ